MRRLLTLLGLLAVASAARWGLDPRAKSSWRPSTKIGGGPQRFGKEHFFRFDGTGVCIPGTHRRVLHWCAGAMRRAMEGTMHTGKLRP